MSRHEMAKQMEKSVFKNPKKFEIIQSPMRRKEKSLVKKTLLYKYVVDVIEELPFNFGEYIIF